MIYEGGFNKSVSNTASCDTAKKDIATGNAVMDNIETSNTAASHIATSNITTATKKGRFAPSPTGQLHLGNIWVALLSYLHIKQQGGRYVVRMEDIDTQRSKRSLGEAQLDDLEWLGIEWDEGPRVGGPDGPYWQSERYDLYEAQLEEWRKADKIYPCYCNRARLHSISSAPHGQDGIAYYDGKCRHLTEAERQAMEKTPSWRLKAESRNYHFTDIWQGEHDVMLQPEVDDFVVRRADNMFAYNLAVVYDDIAMGITEIIRGYDLLPAVAHQLWIYELLGAQPPQYGHVPLIVDEEGYRLSKRQRSITIKELRESGYSASMIIGRLALQAGFVKPGQIDLQTGLTVNQLLAINFDNLSLKLHQIKLTNFDIEI